VILLVAVLAGGWFGRGPAGPTGPTVIRRVVRRPVRTVVEEPVATRRSASPDDVV
jgi:hypothetical protein